MLDNANCAICTLINHFFTGKFNMSLKPICVAIALTLTLTACGSTGSSHSNSIKTVSIETLKNSVDAELREEFGSDGFTKTDSYQINVAGKTYTSGSIDLNNLGNGLQRLDVIETASAKVQGQDYSATRNSKLHLYQQPYSVVAGVQVINGSISDANGNLIRGIGGSDLDINFVKGEATKTLPSAGTYNYAGKAFSQDSSGQFNYAVNFDTRKGSGSITGITEAGKITLQEGTISNLSHTNPDNTTISGFGIQSTATSEKKGNGEYKLGFFGPNAEEVAGTVNQNNNGLVGFGGTKQ